MKPGTLLGVVILLLILAIALLVMFGDFDVTQPQESSSPIASNADESAVRTAVTEFGKKLQTVSLLAAQEVRKAAMNATYGAYVAPELLARWYLEDADALGRSTSSPWPDRIEIVEVLPEGNTMRVKGNVVEVTSADVESGTTSAGVYPVTLVLENRNGTWLIVEAERGAYSKLPQNQILVGRWECLPNKDTSGPQTLECAFGIDTEGIGGHYAVDTSLISTTSPVDFPTGTRVRVSGLVTPVEQLSSVQKYDIEGVIRATTIERVQ